MTTATPTPATRRWTQPGLRSVCPHTRTAATGVMISNYRKNSITPYQQTIIFSDSDGSLEKKKVNREELLPLLASNYRNILKTVGEDPTREGLLETPMRAAKAMTYFTKGYQETVQEVVRNAIFTEETDEMVVVKDIEFFTLCEHHMVPFMGKASVRILTYKTITTAISPGQYRLPAPGQGAGAEQAGEDRGDVQQEAAGQHWSLSIHWPPHRNNPGPGAAHPGGGQRGVGGRGSVRCGGGGGGLPHVHGEMTTRTIFTSKYTF